MSATTNMRTFTAAALVIVACTLKTHARTESIAVEGEQAPGLPAGVLFGDDLGVPVIGEFGSVAHKSNLTGPDITASNDQGIWKSTSLEVRKGDPAPDTPAGVLFADLGDPLIDRLNRITHRSDLTGTGVTTSNDQGIWRDDFLIARQGDQAHDLPIGVVFTGSAFLDNPVAHEEFGVAYYTATFSGTGVNASNNQAIFRSTSLEVREGDVAPDTGGALFGNLGAPRVGDFGQVAHHSFLQTGGNVTSSNNEGIWRDDGLVAREGAAAPGTSAGVVFGNLGDPTMNGLQVAHRSFVSGPGVTSDNDRGIWLGDSLIAHEGSQAPGLPDGVNFRSLGTPIINRLGQVAHQSDLQTGGLVSFANSEAIWRDDTLIAREGSPAGGVPGAIFGGILGVPVINNIGIVAHNSIMEGFVGAAGGDTEGIWLADGIEQVLAVREGDTLAGKTVNFLTLAKPFVPASIEGGEGTPLNDHGQLAFIARFDDGTDGIFKYTPTLHWRNAAPAGDWDDANNWTLGIRPSFLHDVVIDPDHDANIDGPDISTFFRPESVTIGGGGGMATVSIRSNTFDPDAPLTVNYNGHLIIRDTATLPTANIDLGTAPATPLDEPATLTVIGPTADMNISGTTNIAVNAPATLNVTQGTYAFTSGLNVGTSSQGTLNVLSGSDAEVDSESVFGVNDLGTGHLNVDGIGSSILFSGAIHLGADGNAHITATNGGVINADDGITFAESADVTTSADITGPGTQLNGGNFTIGEAGHADVTIQLGATFNPANTKLARDATSTANMLVTDPGTNFTPIAFEIAPATSSATLTIAAGATATPASTLIADGRSGNGTLNVTGPGSTYSTGAFQAAADGSAYVNVEDGGTLNATVGNLAEFTGATSNISVTDRGSSINFTGTVDLGDAGGSATIHIQEGGTLNVPDTATTIGETSGIHINGGTFNASTISGPGKVHLNTGTLHIPNAASFSINSFSFEDDLALNTNATISAENAITVDASMNLNLRGGTLAAADLTNNGNINHNSGTISASRLINNSDLNLGSTTNAIVDANRLNNATTGTITGPGTLTNQLANSGRVHLTGQTLRVQGTATNNFGGLFIGNGTLHANTIVNTSGANMVFSGPTNIIGDVDNQDAPIIGGPPLGLIVSSGPGPLTFFDDVTNNGEIRTDTGGFTVFLGTTSGSGSYTGTGTVVYEADFTPGSSPGINTFAGNLTFGPFATLEIEIGGLLEGSDYDRVEVANTVSLAGTLDVLLTDGFVPAPGDSFEIITAASILDTFEVESLPTLPGSLEWFVNYSSVSVELVSTFAGDFDIDGDVDGFDFLKWQRGESPNSLSQSDLASWQANYRMLASPATTALATVPEPATGIMLLIGVATMLAVGRTTTGERILMNLQWRPMETVEQMKKTVSRQLGQIPLRLAAFAILQNVSSTFVRFHSLPWLNLRCFRTLRFRGCGVNNWRSLLIPCLSSGFIIGVFSSAHSQHENRSPASFSRQVTFELTFAHRDLIWIGDPASPTASIYPKPDARPIATDLCVTTLIKDNVSPRRRYFHEAHIATENGLRNVYAFTNRREKHIGTIDHKGRLSPNAFYNNNRALLPSWPADGSSLTYDDQRNMLYCGIDISGPLVSESLDFLPLKISSANGQAVDGRCAITFAHSDNSDQTEEFGIASLTVRRGQKAVIVASATVPTVFRGTDGQIGSFDNDSGTYLTEAAYRAGATSDGKTEPSVTFTIPGKFSSSLRSDTESLVLVDIDIDIDGDISASDGAKSQVARDKIVIDGNFDDWRNVVGVDDPRGDVVPYLEYIPDVDLLEFKVSHDDQNIYLYARVAGKVGRSHPEGGRAYFYAYMDVDRDAGTGFLPTRDDDCYFGVAIGDDCEVQFEFVDNALRKTFYGFCGIGGNANVLKQQVSIGKSQYGRFDTQGVERANYKSEYIYRNKVTEITEDLKLGTSDTIHLAVSPDGSEVEVSSTFTGFLKNPSGQPTVQLGQAIDLAVGMECDSKAYLGKRAWGADSTRAVRGYTLIPAGDLERVRARKNETDLP